MAFGEQLDPGRLFGRSVTDRSGRVMGRVIALIHRGGGCDVLVERRRWLRRTVARLDLDDLVDNGDRIVHRHLTVARRSTGPRDGWVA